MERIGITPNNMPELPEVETIKNILNNTVLNKEILSVKILRKSIVKSDPKLFVDNLSNEVILSVSRIGKFLIFHLTNDKVFTSHLRMEGKYYLLNENDKNTTHARVIFHFKNGEKLIYDDSRCFGEMTLSNEAEYRNLKQIKKLGKEPFDITSDELYKLSKKSSLPIKSFLLDQSNLSGLGNIYVDETLFLSKIHPLTPAKQLDKKQIETIIQQSISVLTLAIKCGGSTIKSYHPGKGIDGNFQVNIKAYGKKDEPCPVCGHKFRFIKVNGRGTTFCPICQKRKPLIVGLTGKIGSGKSTILETFEKAGYFIIDSDKIVSDLYKKESFIKAFNNKFSTKFNKEIDKSCLRELINANLIKIKDLNFFVHPKVKEEILSLFKSSKQSIIVEVPLLFESKMDYLFDVIIASDIDKDIQLERLKKRNPDKYLDLLKIYNNDSFEKYKKSVTFVVTNNKKKTDLENQIKKIINILE